MIKVYSRALTAQEGSPIGATPEVQEFFDFGQSMQSSKRFKAEIAPALALFQSLCSAWLTLSAMAVDQQAEDALDR